VILNASKIDVRFHVMDVLLSLRRMAIDRRQTTTSNQDVIHLADSLKEQVT